MADETRTPKEVVNEWLRRQGLEVGRHLASDDVTAFAALILRERGRAFDTGMLVGREAATNSRWTYAQTAATRRKIVEGRSDG